MEEEYMDDFEGTYDSDELAPKPKNEQNTEAKQTKGENLTDNESTDFIEFYFKNIEEISNDIMEYNNYKGKNSKSGDVNYLPNQLFTRIEQLSKTLLETFSIDQTLVVLVFERLIVELNNSSTEFMANKLFENAKRIMKFCVDLLTNHKVNVSFLVQKNPSTLINSYNNLATCQIKQFKATPEKYKRNQDEDFALGYLKKAKELILSKKVRSGLATNLLNFSKLFCLKKDHEKALEYATMASNDLQNLEIGEISAHGDLTRSENNNEISIRKQQLRLLSLAHFTVGEEEMHLENMNSALNAFKKAKNTLKRFFGENDSMFKRYNETYEKVSKKVLNNKSPKQMENNQKMMGRPSSKGKRVSLIEIENSRADQGTNSRKMGNLIPMSPSLKHSMSDVSSIDNTLTKKGILKPPKPRNFNNTYENHNNSRETDHNRSRISAKTPINEALCESDDDIYEQVDMQKNMMDFFDNMVQFVGPNHRINKQFNNDVERYRVKKQVKRKENVLQNKRDKPPLKYYYNDVRGKDNSLDINLQEEDSIKFNDRKLNSQQDIKNDSKVIKDEMQKTIEELKIEAERQKLISQASERERLKEEVEKEKLKLEVEKLKQEERTKELNEKIELERKRAEDEELDKKKLIELQEEEKRRLNKEHEEKLTRELENMRIMFKEEMQAKFDEQQKELEKIRKEQQEERARIENEHEEKRREEIQKIAKENEEKLKKEQEEKNRLQKEELERTKREEDLKERLNTLEEERKLKYEEEEKLKKEEFERLATEEDARIEREQEENAKREQEELIAKEQEERLEREEKERIAKEEKERLEREEKERIAKEQEERLEREEKERIAKEQEERLEREEKERIEKEQEERLEREEKERIAKEEKERLEREEEERIAREEDERIEKEQAENLKREEEEKTKREEERIAKEQQERLEREEEERIAREEDERIEKEQAENAKREAEEENAKREEEERIKREEEEKVKKEEERIAKEEDERIEKEQAENLKREEEEKIAREQQEKTTREQEEKLKREEEEKTNKQESDKFKQQLEDKLSIEENFDDMEFDDSLKSIPDSPVNVEQNDLKVTPSNNSLDTKKKSELFPIIESEEEQTMKGDQLLPGSPEKEASLKSIESIKANPVENHNKKSSSCNVNLLDDTNKESELKSNTCDIFDDLENSLDNVPESKDLNKSNSKISKEEALLPISEKRDSLLIKDKPEDAEKKSNTEELQKNDNKEEQSNLNKSIEKSKKSLKIEQNKKIEILQDSPVAKEKIPDEDILKKKKNKQSTNISNDDFYDDFLIEDDEKDNENKDKLVQKAESQLSKSELYNKSKVSEINDFDDLDEMEEL